MKKVKKGGIVAGLLALLIGGTMLATPDDAEAQRRQFPRNRLLPRVQRFTGNTSFTSFSANVVIGTPYFRQAHYYGAPLSSVGIRNYQSKYQSKRNIEDNPDYQHGVTVGRLQMLNQWNMAENDRLNKENEWLYEENKNLREEMQQGNVPQKPQAGPNTSPSGGGKEFRANRYSEKINKTQFAGEAATLLNAWFDEMYRSDNTESKREEWRKLSATTRANAFGYNDFDLVVRYKDDGTVYPVLAIEYGDTQTENEAERISAIARKVARGVAITYPGKNVPYAEFVNDVFSSVEQLNLSIPTPGQKGYTIVFD